jgi:hypothetical protein
LRGILDLALGRPFALQSKKCLKIFVFVCCFDHFGLIIILIQKIKIKILHQMPLDKLVKIIHKGNQLFPNFFILQFLETAT